MKLNNFTQYLNEYFDDPMIKKEFLNSINLKNTNELTAKEIKQYFNLQRMNVLNDIIDKKSYIDQDIKTSKYIKVSGHEDQLKYFSNLISRILSNSKEQIKKDIKENIYNNISIENININFIKDTKIDFDKISNNFLDKKDINKKYSIYKKKINITATNEFINYENNMHIYVYLNKNDMFTVISNNLYDNEIKKTTLYISEDFKQKIDNFIHTFMEENILHNFLSVFISIREQILYEIYKKTYKYLNKKNDIRILQKGILKENQSAKEFNTLEDDFPKTILNNYTINSKRPFIVLNIKNYFFEIFFIEYKNPLLIYSLIQNNKLLTSNIAEITEMEQITDMFNTIIKYIKNN